VPNAAVADTDRIISDRPEPGARMEAGLKLTLTPDGWPVALKAMAESKLPEIVVVTMTYPLVPLYRYPDEGDTEMVKLPDDGAVTVSDTVAVCVRPPPVPVTVMV